MAGAVQVHADPLMHESAVDTGCRRARWRLSRATAAGYSFMEIADASRAVPRLRAARVEFAQLQAVVRKHRYDLWPTALPSGVDAVRRTSECRCLYAYLELVQRSSLVVALPGGVGAGRNLLGALPGAR